jgi:hypothetical protein
MSLWLLARDDRNHQFDEMVEFVVRTIVLLAVGNG